MKIGKFFSSILILAIAVIIANSLIKWATNGEYSLKATFCNHEFEEPNILNSNDTYHTYVRKCTKCGMVKRTNERHNYEVKECIDTGENHESHYCCSMCGNSEFPTEVEPHNYDSNNLCVCGKYYPGREVVQSGKAQFAITRPRNGEFGQEVYVIFAGAGEMSWALEVFRYESSEDSIIIVTQLAGNDWENTIDGLIPILEELAPYYNINLIGFSAGGPGAVQAAVHLSECDVSQRTNTLHVVEGSFNWSYYNIYLDLAKKAWNVKVYGGCNGSTDTGSILVDTNNGIGHRFINEGLTAKDDVVGRLDYQSYNCNHGMLDDIVFEEIMGVSIP